MENIIGSTSQMNFESVYISLGCVNVNTHASCQIIVWNVYLFLLATSFTRKEILKQNENVYFFIYIILKARYNEKRIIFNS